MVDILINNCDQPQFQLKGQWMRRPSRKGVLSFNRTGLRFVGANREGGFRDDKEECPHAAWSGQSYQAPVIYLSWAVLLWFPIMESCFRIA
jgi:hypothetical protein